MEGHTPQGGSSGGGRAWQRGGSKNARGFSGARGLQPPSDADVDPMMSTVQKSIIASIVQGARASLHDNLRPVTPGDLPRHLFSGDDYTNRPGSSYKMKNVVGQAIDEFNSAIGNTTAMNTTQTSMGVSSAGSGFRSMGSSSKMNVKGMISRSDSQNRGDNTNIMEVLQKAEMTIKARPNQLPSLEPLSKSNSKGIKGFESNKPVKVVQQASFTADSPSTAEKASTETSLRQQEAAVSQFSIPAQGLPPKKVSIKRPGSGEGAGKPIKVNKKNQSPSKREEAISKEDDEGKQFKDLLKSDSRLEDMMRFDQNKMENLQKLQQIQMQIKSANRQRGGKAKEETKTQPPAVDENQANDYDDAYENYFENQMIQDMEGIEQYEQQIDYFEELKKVEDRVAKQGPRAVPKRDDIKRQQSNEEDGLDDGYLMEDDIDQMEGELAQDAKASAENPYVTEYQEVINQMSRLCSIIGQNQRTENKEKKVKIDESELLELCPRIWALATEYDKQNQKTKSQCHLETILKGSFSLLAIKHPRSVIRLSAVNVQLFLKIFDRYIFANSATLDSAPDFKKIFNYLFETMRGILIYAKEGSHDLLFKEESLIPQLSKVMQTCYIDHSQVIVRLTSQTVNKKEITNEDLIYDLVNYTIGGIKCFTQSNNEVQKEAVKHGYIILLSKCMEKSLTFGKNQTKRSQMLVQITGALRNLANDDDSYQRVCKNKVIPKLLQVLETFKGSKELMLNISRILSKISSDTECSKAIISTKKLDFLVSLIDDFQAFTPFLVRISFVLANLTTYSDEAREQLGTIPEHVFRILRITLSYFDRDESAPQDTEGGAQVAKGGKEMGNTEDTLVKLIRLVANICTDEQYIHTIVGKPEGRELLCQYMSKMIAAVKRKKIAKSEEFILNAVSCATNLLFYDTPNEKDQIFTSALRMQIFQVCHPYILETSNEELQIEAVRVLSNLSRHGKMCETFVGEKTFVEGIVVVLDHTLRELVFYTIGIVINVTMHEAPRKKLTHMQPALIPKLIDVLRDANIEDMDLSKVSAKALHNLVIRQVGDGPSKEDIVWQHDWLKKLDEILSSLGEELDSIMDVANDEELEEIKGLRELINALINDMPETAFECPDINCGRKFKNKEELDKHVERRHNKAGGKGSQS